MRWPDNVTDEQMALETGYKLDVDCKVDRTLHCDTPASEFVNGRCPICGELRYPRHPLTGTELAEAGMKFLKKSHNAPRSADVGAGSIASDKSSEERTALLQSLRQEAQDIYDEAESKIRALFELHGFKIAN